MADGDARDVPEDDSDENDEDFVPGGEDDDDGGDGDDGADDGANAEDGKGSAPPRKRPRSKYIQYEADDDDADDDEEDEEEDEEDEEGGTARKAAKKARARGGAQEYIDGEAVDDDEDGYDEEYDDEEVDDELQQDLADGADEDIDFARNRQENELYYQEQLKREEEKLQEQARRYQDQEHVRNLYRGQSDTLQRPTEVQKGEDLPTADDPKLFLVRCKPGKEREVVVFMMQKYQTHMNTSERMPISSVVATAVKGFVYVEAKKEAHVRSAIHSIPFLFQKDIKIVPNGEMTRALQMPAKKDRQTSKLDVGSWVRLKRPAEYKDDLASVLSIDDLQATNQITVRIVPRLDYTILAREPGEDGARRKSGVRPAARLFSFAEAQNAGFEPYILERGARAGQNVYAVEHPREYAGMRFEDGFYIRVVRVDHVKLDASPSAHEVEVFRSMLAAVGKEAESLKLLQGMESEVKAALKTAFVPGDTVRVVKDDLKNLTATVLQVNADGSMRCRPHDERAQLDVLLRPDQVTKHFVPGDHVQVLRGPFAGETGLLVKVEEDTLTLFSDLSKHEIEVRPTDVTEAGVASAGRETLGAYALHDLVQLDHTAAGVIVKVEHSSFKVLDTAGDVRTVRLSDMGRKLSSKATPAVDGEQRPISVGDVVVTDDARQGTIKHLYKAFVFLHSRDVSENSGVFVARSRQTKLVDGGGAKHVPGPSYAVAPRMDRSEVFREPTLDRGRGGRGRGHGRGRGRGDELANANVRIQAGPYKGMFGMVRSSSDSIARVELTAKQKTVTVDKSKLLIVDEGDSGAGRAYAGGGVGVPPGAAMLGLPTPVRDDGWRTPMRDNFPQTPMRDSMPMTPMHPGAEGGGSRADRDPWDPSMTPAHNPFTSSRAQTPSRGFGDEHGSGHGDDVGGLNAAPQWPPRNPAGAEDR